MAPKFMLQPRLSALAARARGVLATRIAGLSSERATWSNLANKISPIDQLLFGITAARALDLPPTRGGERNDLYARLISRQFQIEVAEPALDRILNAAFEKPSQAVLRWTQKTFNVEGDPDHDRLHLLARVLESAALAADLDSADVVWSVAALTTALRRAARRSQASQAPQSLGVALSAGTSWLSHLANIAKGLQVAHLEDAEPSTSEWAQFHPGGVISFSLSAKVAAASDFCQIDFGAIVDGASAPGALWLDYGGGFAPGCRVQLTPMGRLRYAAVVATAGLQSLKWEPTNAGGAVLPVLLTARPVAWAEVEQRTRTIAGEDGLDRLNSAIVSAQHTQNAVAISRSLTRDLGGHKPFERTYAHWIKQHEPQGQEAERLWRAQIVKMRHKPLISILVPVYETPRDLLREMIDSVRAQCYEQWELCIADDGSASPHVRETLQHYAEADTRIKVAFRDCNGHISAASNTALELATGEWTALLDHDDVLRPNALLALACEINDHPEAELIYSDEDKLDLNGDRVDPFFKPDYSPELLLAQNYLNHLTAHRTANIRNVGGWRLGYEGSQDYDLNLRIIEQLDPATIRHIPQVLYHWRMTEGSTALAPQEKNYAAQTGLKAIAEHLARRAPDSRVDLLASGYYRVRHPTPHSMLVSLIIPTRDKAELLAQCVDSILLRSTYPNYEILIVDNGSVEDATKQLFSRLVQDHRVRVLSYDAPFNYSAINNFAAAQANGDIIGLVNNDIEVITPDWLEEMVSWAARDDIGCVGAKLYYDNGMIQHAGVILGIGGVAGHSHKYYPRESSGYFSRLVVHHNVSAVTAACLLVRRTVFEAVGGLDEELAVAFNDVDLCIKVQTKGYRNIFTPYAELFHHESASRGSEDTPEKKARFSSEVRWMQDRWFAEIQADRYYSPNLSLVHENYELRWFDE